MLYQVTYTYRNDAPNVNVVVRAKSANEAKKKADRELNHEHSWGWLTCDVIPLWKREVGTPLRGTYFLCYLVSPIAEKDKYAFVYYPHSDSFANVDVEKLNPIRGKRFDMRTIEDKIWAWRNDNV